MASSVHKIQWLRGRSTQFKLGLGQIFIDCPWVFFMDLFFFPVMISLFNLSFCMNQKTKKLLDMSHFPSTTYMERCSTSFIRDIFQIKTAMTYYLTPVRIAIIKKSTNNKCLRERGEKGTLMHCWWQCKLPQCKLIQPPWRTVRRFLKKLKIELLATPSWAYTQRKP